MVVGRAGRIGALAGLVAVLGAAGPGRPDPAEAATSPAPRRLATGQLTPRAFELPPRTIGPAPRTRGAGIRTFSTLGAVPVGLAGPVPLSTFEGSFGWGGRTYRYTMMGSSPSGAARTTVLPNTIVPITVTVGGSTIATSPATVAVVTRSGLFTPRTFPGGTGQYGDVFMRTQFWTTLGNGTRNWHVAMATPTVKPTVRLSVPSGKGALATVGGVPVAFVDADWLDAATLPWVRGAAPHVLTQLLTTNVVACAPYTVDLSACGIGGYHSAVADARGVHTYTYQSYLNAAIFGAATGFTDIGPMSHELAEWITDPYVDNQVPAWYSPLAPQYGCMEELESGDPVVGRFVRINGLAYQDEAYLAWFARSASGSWQGRYTWFDSFESHSPSC